MTNQSQPAIETYLMLVGSYVRGFVRFAEARITSLSLQNVVLEFVREGAHDLEAHPYIATLSRVKAITKPGYDAFSYITNISHLVYLTTLLDTFLTDTTKFLLLLHPKAIGTNQAVSLGQILEAKTTAQLVSEAAQKRAREISYLSFTARIEFLSEKFGLHLTLTEDEVKELERFSDIRNTAIHDQGIFECELAQSGHVTLRQKACPVHPTPINDGELGIADKAYRAVVREVCTSVVEQVLKGSQHPRYVSLRELLVPGPLAPPN